MAEPVAPVAIIMGSQSDWETMHHAAETLALPIYPELSKAQLDHVIASVADFYGSSAARRAAS